MRLITTLVLALSVFLLSGCVEKLPLQPQENTGILLFPTKVTNTTGYHSLFHYSYYYSPVTPVKIVIKPHAGKKYILFDNFPAGNYYMTGVGIASAPNPKLTYYGTDKKKMFDKPTQPFEIKANEITILPMQLLVNMEHVHATNSLSQDMDIVELSDEERTDILAELEKSENWDRWKVKE